MTYTPQPGTAAFRIVAWLEAQGRTKEFNSSQIGYALHLDTKGLPAQLESALQAGLVFRRQKDTSTPRSPWYYSLTDHGAVHRREFRPAPKDWMQPLKDAAGPPASDGAASEGTAVTPGPSQPEAAPDTPQGDQPRSERGREVMEPEACESAAGRGTNGAPALATLPQHASPGVGPMGAGQPADAGPTTDESAAQQGTNPVRRVGPAASSPAALPPVVVEQRREVDEHFAATLREAMDYLDDDERLPPADLAATRRAVRAPHEPAPLAFRAARFSDGTLATERDGMVVAVYSAAEVDAIQKLLGART